MTQQRRQSTSQKIFILLLTALCSLTSLFSPFVAAQSQQPASAPANARLSSHSPLATPTTTLRSNTLATLDPVRQAVIRIETTTPQATTPAGNRNKAGKVTERGSKPVTTQHLLFLPIASKPPPLARVAASVLNVRNGPGTHYGVIGSIRYGTTLVITGQSRHCTWVAVQLSDGSTGWIVGIGFTQINQDCTTIPVLE